MRNINISEPENIIPSKTGSSIDFSKEKPEADDALANLFSTTKKVENIKEALIKSDIDFKQGASMCMATFENLEWRDLTMCNAYFKNALV